MSRFRRSSNIRFAFVALGCLMFLVACGIFRSSSSPAGYVRVVIQWPEIRAQLIPAVSQSVKVEVLQATSTVVDSLLVVRPDTQGTLGPIPVGPALLRATAYPNADGTGTPLAIGEQPSKSSPTRR